MWCICNIILWMLWYLEAQTYCGIHPFVSACEVVLGFVLPRRKPGNLRSTSVCRPFLCLHLFTSYPFCEIEKSNLLADPCYFISRCLLSIGFGDTVINAVKCTGHCGCHAESVNPSKFYFYFYEVLWGLWCFVLGQYIDNMLMVQSTGCIVKELWTEKTVVA